MALRFYTPNMNWKLNFAFVGLTTVALTSFAASAQEACSYLGETVCRQSGAHLFQYRCEDHNGVLRFAFKGNCQVEDVLSGTWQGTQNCSGEVDQLDYRIRQTGLNTFNGDWADMSGTVHRFNGTISGEQVTWQDMGATYYLRLSRMRNNQGQIVARLDGTLALQNVPGCKVQLRRVN